MNRRTFLIGLASAAVAPALPAASHGIRAGDGMIGAPRVDWCHCAVVMLESKYKPGYYTMHGVPHIAGCTWGRIAGQ